MGRDGATRAEVPSARRRLPAMVAIAAGVAAAVTGLALLVVPAAPIEARAGSVLDEPAGSSPADAGRAAVPPAAEPVPGVVVPAGPFELGGVPVEVVAGFVPDRLVVEALGVDSSLVTTLVDDTGALVPPQDPAELGWWRGVRPGAGAGSVVVAGHIDSSRYGQGPLARLVDLVPGDRAVVLGADGGRAEYVVRGVETFAKDSLPAADLFGTDGPERLVLVTCGGRYDRRLGSWDSNIVAVLDPVPPA